jgi:GAF domain
MGEDRSRRIDEPLKGFEPESSGESTEFSKRTEKEILLSISAGASLAEVLNRICNALDCEIGNVISLASLLDEDTTDFATIAGTAKQFGLHKFCSVGVFAANQELLGTLDMYSCKPELPSARELELIKRAGRLVAIAIERVDKALEDVDAVAAELRPVRRRVLEWPKIVN